MVTIADTRKSSWLGVTNKNYVRKLLTYSSTVSIGEVPRDKSPLAWLFLSQGFIWGGGGVVAKREHPPLPGYWGGGGGGVAKREHPPLPGY